MMLWNPPDTASTWKLRVGLSNWKGQFLPELQRKAGNAKNAQIHIFALSHIYSKVMLKILPASQHEICEISDVFGDLEKRREPEDHH